MLDSICAGPEIRRMIEERDKISLEYTVDSTYKDEFEAHKAKYWATPIPVFLNEDKSQKPLPPSHYQDILVGSLVEVTFTLNWYNFGKSDTFTARVRRFTILEEGTNSSNSISLSNKKRHEPQTPSRGEHMNY